MRLTPFSKFMLALVIVGGVGYGLFLNHDKLGIKIPNMTGNASSPGSGTTASGLPPVESSSNQKELIMEGSTAMTRLGVDWGKMFDTAHPGLKFQRGWGGTGRGIDGLLGGTVDLAAASRPLTAKEEKMAGKKGMKIKSIAVAIDAIAVIVNRSNSVTDLSMPQLAGIYSGRINNWREVGGKSMPITFYGRESTAGMYEFFKDKVLGKTAYSPRMKVATTTTGMIQAIAKEPGAIGTATIAQSLKQKTVKLLGLRKAADEPAVYPFFDSDINIRAIRQSTYPLTRDMYLMTNGEPTGLVKDFVDLALSPSGQQVVRDEGYVPVT